MWRATIVHIIKGYDRNLGKKKDTKNETKNDLHTSFLRYVFRICLKILPFFREGYYEETSQKLRLVDIS